MKEKIRAKVRFIPKAKTFEEWQTENEVLLAGEHGVVIDKSGFKREKIGDGVTPWNELAWWSGASAYEVAVKNGFDGTEEEWLDSLKGDRGEKGEKGEKGDPGTAINVDTDYNPKSLNAQSGTAVAEAMGSFETKITTVSGDVSSLNQLYNNLREDTSVLLINRAHATDTMAYNNEDNRVPYLYGVYGDSDGKEQQGLIKGSTGKLRKQMAEPFEESDPEIYQSIIEGRIPSEQIKLLDPHTIAIRDGNCAVPVGLHIYDEDKNGNITNSQLFYSAATPQSYVQHLFATLKTITTVGVSAGCKYTFDWNAMYFFKSNSGKTDITLLDSDGNNVIGSLKCSYGLLILPKASYVRSEWTSNYDPTNSDYDDGNTYVDGNRKESKLHGLFAGMTDKTALVTTDKIQMLQFDLNPDKNVSITPVSESVIVYKIAF